ncbi:MAG: 2-oxoacid:ferredoxin oxidoreductase subunit beta [Acidobacteriota bacterium]
MSGSGGRLIIQEPRPLTRMDFTSDQTVRWCPGCGDYSILAQMQRTFAELGLRRANQVFISGIGCQSRLPYYMNTYGFHTIHGRALPIATGLKATRPDLDVWVVTGDGDGLSIGGNHLLHCLRRNLNINVILINNRIYGLTKGQYSPTSEFGKRTKTSPDGTIEHPVNALCVAIAAEATFIARSVDTWSDHLRAMLRRAYEHQGTAFLEIYQNCNIFNDGAFADFAAREVRDERMLQLEHGKPMIFGKDRNRGIRLRGVIPEVVRLGNGISEEDLLVHDENTESATHAYLLTQMASPHYPVPVGVFRAVERSTYDQLLQNQVDTAIRDKGEGTIGELLKSGETWTIS